MKRAFTLVEVTLAMGIMAVGIMSVVGLYAFGFRESGQSREDVGATAVADAVLGQLSMAISATNLNWRLFKDLPSYPSDEGWGYFINRNTESLSFMIASNLVFTVKISKHAFNTVIARAIINQNKLLINILTHRAFNGFNYIIS